MGQKGHCKSRDYNKSLSLHELAQHINHGLMKNV